MQLMPMPISSWLVVAAVFSLSCGRIGFDPIDGDGGFVVTGDGGFVVTGDGSLSGPDANTSGIDAGGEVVTCPTNSSFICFGQSGPVVNGSINFSGRLEEFTVNHSPTCGIGSGEYRVEFTNGGGPTIARFRVESSIDTLIYALNENCVGAELGCENNNDNNASQEALILNLSAGQTVIIVVEGIAACGGNISIIQDIV